MDKKWLIITISTTKNVKWGTEGWIPESVSKLTRASLKRAGSDLLTVISVTFPKSLAEAQIRKPMVSIFPWLESHRFAHKAAAAREAHKKVHALQVIWCQQEFNLLCTQSFHYHKEQWLPRQTKGISFLWHG